MNITEFRGNVRNMITEWLTATQTPEGDIKRIRKLEKYINSSVQSNGNLSEYMVNPNEIKFPLDLEAMIHIDFGGDAYRTAKILCELFGMSGYFVYEMNPHEFYKSRARSKAGTTKMGFGTINRLLSFRSGLPVSIFKRNEPGKISIHRLDGDNEQHDRVRMKLIEKIVKTRNLCFGEDGGLSEHTQAESFTTPMSKYTRLYVAMKYGDTISKDEILGYAKVSTLSSYSDNEWSIDYFCAKGAGKLMMQRIINDGIADPDCNAISLSALATAVTFYRKLGFVHDKRSGVNKCNAESIELQLYADQIGNSVGNTPGAILADASLRRYFNEVIKSGLVQCANPNDLGSCFSSLWFMRICLPNKVQASSKNKRKRE
jgi:hypothetical protein